MPKVDHGAAIVAGGDGCSHHWLLHSGISRQFELDGELILAVFWDPFRAKNSGCELGVDQICALWEVPSQSDRLEFHGVFNLGRDGIEV